MRRLSKSNLHTIKRGFVSVMAVTVMSALSIVAPTSVAQATERAADYATSLVVKRNGEVITDGDGNQKPIGPNQEFFLEFNWAVGNNEKPEPGDNLTVNLPDWLLASANQGVTISAGNYTTCNFSGTAAEIECTFTDAVTSDISTNIRGFFGVTVHAVEEKTSAPVQWGSTSNNVYKILTGEDEGTIGKITVTPDNANIPDIAKSGAYSRELSFQGKRYLQLFWSVLVPPSKVGNKIELTDTLPQVELIDPDTQQKVQAKHIIASASGGPVRVSRRSGAAIENGSWETKDSPKCDSNGIDKRSGAPCAEVVSTTVRTDGSIENKTGEETVTYTGVTGENNFQENDTITITVDNVKPDTAYRLTFYSWIQADALSPDAGVNTPVINNTVTVNGESIQSRDVKVYTKFWGNSSADPNRTEIVVKKAIEPATATPDVTTFPLNINVSGADSTCDLSVNDSCTIMAQNTDTVTITEPEVQNSAMQWKPGVFSVSDQSNPQSTVNLNGNSVTVTNPKPGEKFVLIVTNEVVADGGFKIIKKVDTTSGVNVPTDKAFAFDYTCSNGSTTIGPKTLNVKLSDVDGVSAGSIPAGYICKIVEKPESAKINGYTWTAPQISDVTIKSNEVTPVEVTNAYTRDLGSVKVTKKVIVDGKDAPTDDTFNIHYTCGANEGDLTVKGNGDATEIPDVPVNTDCTLTETDGERDGYTKATKFTVDGAATNVVAVKEKNKAVDVVVTNTYVRDTGGVVITKDVTGSGAYLAPQKFTFNYTCVGDDAAQTEKSGTVTVEPGTPVQLDDVASGTCTFTEDNADVDNATVTTTIDVDGVTTTGNQAQVNVVKGATTKVHVTNDYTVKTARFGITKTVSGWPSFSEDTFHFNYECKVPSAADITGTIDAPGNGTEVVADVELPVGTTCVVTEDIANAERDTFFLKATEKANFEVTGSDADTVIPVKMENTYITWLPLLLPLVPLLLIPLGQLLPKHSPAAPLGQQPAAPAQQEPPTKGIAKDPAAAKPQAQQAQQRPTLAQTGASVLGIVALAIVLVALGVFLVRRNRKTS